MTELRLVLTALALAVAMLLAGLVGRHQRVGSVILSLLSLVWLTVDHGFEGPVLLTVTRKHGLTLTDLIGLAGLGVAIWLWSGRRERVANHRAGVVGANQADDR